MWGGGRIRSTVELAQSGVGKSRESRLTGHFFFFGLGGHRVQMLLTRGGSSDAREIDPCLLSLPAIIRVPMYVLYYGQFCLS